MPLWGNLNLANNAPKFSINVGQQPPAGAVNAQTLFANTQSGAYQTNKTVGVFGVSAAEADSKTGNIASVTIVAAGDSFTARPTITIAGSNTAQATVTANGTVVAVSIAAGQAGTSWNVGDVMYLGTGTSSVNCAITVTSINTAASNAVTGIALTRGGDYTTLTAITLAVPSYNTSTFGASANGVSFKANLSYGIGSTAVPTPGINYTYNDPLGTGTSNVSTTIGGAGGANAKVYVTLTGQEGSKVGGAGWVLRTQGTGGRAGRTQYEVLVAMGSLTGSSGNTTIIAP
jgi:hypothetical protein